MSIQGTGAPGGMNNLTTLIKRLEAATSRLEDIANSASQFDPPSGSVPPQDSFQASASAPELTGLDHKDGREASTSTVKPISQPLPASIAEMDELLVNEVQAFVDSSKDVDILVEEQAQSVSKAFADQRRFLLTSTKAKKPDMQSQTFMDLLTDLQHDMGAVGDFRDSHRASPMKEHLAMVGEGISALQWLIMDGKPADYVGEVVGGAQLYGNRVLKSYKDGDQSHVRYVQAYYALLKALQSYIKSHYPSGVTWNNNGSADALQVYRDAEFESPAANGLRSPSASPASGAPGPPPPPPPPLPTFDKTPPSGGSKSPSATGTSGDMGAVFQQLNRGESVTSGLKKVDHSQMTHKNPSLRAGAIVPDSTPSSSSTNTTDISRSRSPGPEIKPKPAGMRQNSQRSTKSTSSAQAKKEPKKELDGNKWLIENHDSPKEPLTIEVSLTQSVSITNCKNTTIILKGKANAISIDNSPKTQILVESLVSSIDVIKCPSFAVQITGFLPTVMLDQVDGASIYLGKDSLNTEVFTSKCSSVNVVLPPEDEEGEGDSTEHPLPEQIRSFVKDGKVVSEIVEHAG